MYRSGAAGLQAELLWGAGIAVGCAGAAALMERRRQRRRVVHGVGWVPWPGLMLTALFAAAMLVALGLRS
jgi:hypothetical protein